MTADEVRKQFSAKAFEDIIGMHPQNAAFTLGLSMIVLMGEVAAQLAEIQDVLRDIEGLMARK